MEAFKTVIFNSHNEYFRYPQGAIPCGSLLTLKILVHAAVQATSVTLRLWQDGKEERLQMQKGKFYSSCAFGNYLQEYFINVSRETISLAWYYFIIDCGKKRLFCVNNAEMLGGEGDVIDFEDQTKSFQITVISPDFTVPDWAQGATMYQIFPDRFFRAQNSGFQGKKRLHENWSDAPEYLPGALGYYAADDFFGGNLKGIEQKLDYIKSLGVDVIYLNPIFSAYSNHRYDTADYEQVDALLGTNEDFISLCKAAKRKKMRIILDGVFSHTGSNSKYFNRDGCFDSLGAYQSKDSEYYSWYEFQDFPDEYTSWWGVWSLPCVNELDEKYLDYIILNKNSVSKQWLLRGASGWRLDVADELPDEFIKHLRKNIKEKYPDALILGEVWEDASNKISYEKQREFLLGAELDTVMNYPLRKAILNYLKTGDAKDFCRHVLSLRENYPKQTFYSLMNFISTHDTPRIVTELSVDTKHLTREEKAQIKIDEKTLLVARAKQKLAALICFALPGMPCIYYGDEHSLSGASDPFNRKPMPWDKQDAEMLTWYKLLGKLRDKTLKEGELTLDGEGALLSIKRTLDKKEKCFLINQSDDSIETMLDTTYFKNKPKLIGASAEGVQISPREQGWYILIPARCGVVFES